MARTPAWRRLAFGTLLAGLCLVLESGGAASAKSVLERVVVVMRHGVRPPTQGPDALARLSGKPWPAWPVPAGDLTPHGAKTVALMGRTLRDGYRARGVLPLSGCPAAGAIQVRSDGQDQRTRESGRAVLEALAPGCGLVAQSGPEGAADSLFDSLALCPLDATAAKAAIDAAAGPEGLVTAAARRALDLMQKTAAPDGCATGGLCLATATTVSIKPSGVKLEGPLAQGGTLAEIFLLEYAEGLPMEEVAWGAARDPAFLETVLKAHEREADLIRRTLPIATHRGFVMARAILRALEGHPKDSGDGPKLLVFAGHDTNLSNIAGIFGLDWTLEGQPDATAPSTALAFEVWREPFTGKEEVRPVIYYETLEQLRTLKPDRAQPVALHFGMCGDARGCPLTTLVRSILGRVPAVCVDPNGDVARTTRARASALDGPAAPIVGARF